MKIAFQRGLAASQHHIVHRVVFQIAQRGSVSVLSREEVFVNAEHCGTAGALTLASAQFKEIVEPTFDGGAADPFSLAQPAAADAIPVFERHTAPEWFGGSFARQNPRKSLPKGASAIPAPPLTGLQLQQNMAHAPTLVP